MTTSSELPSWDPESPKVVADMQNVSFRYEDSANGVTDVTITAKQGERILLLGHNGSGKSTILSLFGGKHKAQKGTCTVLGTDAFDNTALNDQVFLIGAPWPPEAYFANTVEAVCSPAKLSERRRQIANDIHLGLKRQVDKMSAGEKRRVQILHGYLTPPEVLLLDECSTEIDVAERSTVLKIAADESRRRGTCCFYATHILDSVATWATRVIHIDKGRVAKDEPFAERLALNAEQVAHRWLSNSSTETVGFPAPQTIPSFPPADAPNRRDLLALSCERLTHKDLFREMSLEVPKGARCLLVGCNGCGKTTFLHMVVGKQFFANSRNELTVFGRPCYQDSRLNEVLSFGGNWWPKAPGGEVHVREMAPAVLSERAERVRQILRIDLSWDVRKVSAGELKRIQLFMGLMDKKELIVLDEATADLDLDMRHVLLRFLHEESEREGVTIIYTTHIFEGLTNWATDCIVMDSTRKGVFAHWRGAEEISIDKIVAAMLQLKKEEAFNENPEVA